MTILENTEEKRSADQFTEKVRLPYFRYLLLVGGVGIVVLLIGIFQIPSYQPFIIFLLLIGLATLAQFSATSFPVGKEGGITYQVSPAIAAAAIPFLGPFAAVIIEATAALSLWILKPANEKTWKKSWEQLVFNTAMNAIAMACAGMIFIWVQSFWVEDSFWCRTIPWVAAAAVNDQVSLWLLIGIMKLSGGREVNIFAIWRDNIWAMVIGISLFSVGGGLLSFSIQEFGWIGGAVFFLPIVLSSFAFRLYVRQMQSHLDNLEEIISERTEKLQQVIAERDSFLAVLTHDMKTPLTSIGIYADILKMDPDILHQKPEISSIIKRSQKNLLEIVENILDLAKFQAGESIELNKTRFCFNNLIKETVETMQPMAQKNKIDLKFNLAAEESDYCGDIYQIGRVLQNLISNAIKYSPQGSIVEIQSVSHDGHLHIEVQDNGHGIPQQEQALIFNRFHRVKSHAKVASGTGLGLAITKALIEAHEGRIVVTSEEGVGTTFSIELPLIGIPQPV